MRGDRSKISRGTPLPPANWQSPSQLLPCPSVDELTAQADAGNSSSHVQQPLTVYTVRLSTGMMRGAALADSNSGVNLCLVSKDGGAVLRRISPVNDPAQVQIDLARICQLGDSQVGADCSLVGKPVVPGASPLPPRPPKLRFQEGSVDEVSFLAPELGNLAAVVVGTEHGTWFLDEVHVSSSRTSHMDRFICRRLLGASRGEGAAYLTPVPPGSVIYGTGDSAVLLSKEQASTLHSLSVSEYEDLKERLLSTTLILAASGTSIAGLTAGAQAAVPFLIGGVAGVAYQWLLQQGVENVMANVGRQALPPPSGLAPSSSSLARSLFGSPIFRLAFVVATISTVIALSADEPIAGTAVVAGGSSAVDAAAAAHGPWLSTQASLWQLMVGLLGFMSYKVALVTVALMPGEDAAAKQVATKQYEKY